ncbi:DUF998 domain-containing protein [Exiguobacterium sp. SH5S13]|uniref:DUF998 domain-containing protein n=1 Tax=Exiguobacterium sp. SH5S13 TaxID=2510959 RepID=UPI00103CF1D2|nr:DUF998 domain-containing protein [Exiguobacterium sp. SH5S13]TCI53145.1 DUF998 domain-containing protein [Exiguobacterium sp. SH5S13]
MAARLVFLAFLVVSTVLPLFSFDGYSLVSNTTSHLGAQASPHAWVMNVTFIALGVMTVLVTLTTRVRYHQVFGALFGTSLLLTGIFHHAPLMDGVPVDLFHDQMHSVFANATGFTFTLLAAGHGFMSHGRQRVAGFLLAAIAVIIPLCMWLAPDYMGLLQRTMFISAFWWLFFYMKPDVRR